jgi:hypothetical protein
MWAGMRKGKRKMKRKMKRKSRDAPRRVSTLNPKTSHMPATLRNSLFLLARPQP